MNMSTDVNVTVEKDTRLTKRPIKVCMHLTDAAYGDYRVMREATALVEAGYDVTIVNITEEVHRLLGEIQGASERGVFTHELVSVFRTILRLAHSDKRHAIESHRAMISGSGTLTSAHDAAEELERAIDTGERSEGREHDRKPRRKRG